MSGAANLAAEQRLLGHAVAESSDAALARVVAVFDRIPDRREADRLLDAARPRLRRLRPARPISFARLLFLPLDGVIVRPREWQRRDGSLPRGALPPIAEAVRLALGTEVIAIEAAFAGASFADAVVIGAAGNALWAAAAAAGPRLQVPPRWSDSGLSPADFGHCTDIALGVWRHARPLWAALAVAHAGPPADLVRGVLADAAQETPAVIGAMLATLLLRAAHPGSVAATARGSGSAGHGVADHALDRWLDGCDPDVPADDAADAARLAEFFAEAMEDLEASGALRQADRRQRAATLRRRVDATCRAIFADRIRATLLEPIATRTGPIDDATIACCEASARALRRLEQAGRALGGGTAYDAALRSLTDGLAGLRRRPDVAIADIARLTEIIAGPEAALRVLEQP